MSDWLLFPVLFVALLTGLFAILVTYRLNKKYRLNYLSTYLYFQIFLASYGVYGLAGQIVVKKILQEDGAALLTVVTIGHFFSFLGIPLLILGWYMFLRLCREIIEKKLSRALTMGYFFALIPIYLAYGVFILILNLSSLRETQYEFFSSALAVLFIAAEALIYFFALLQLLGEARYIPDGTKRKALRNFALLNLFFFGASFIFALTAALTPEPFFISLSLLAFFVRNVPPVLYWRSYLQKHSPPPVLERTDMRSLRQFFEEFKITKREEEVIQQLCEGKTNKEISQTLFISLQTVKDHVYNIYQKTNVRNRVQLINLIQGYGSEKQEMASR